MWDEGDEWGHCPLLIIFPNHIFEKLHHPRAQMNNAQVCLIQPIHQSVTFVKILMRMNVRIYSYQQSYTNEYPNIFILIFLTQTNVRISIRIENCTNIRIFV